MQRLSKGGGKKTIGFVLMCAAPPSAPAYPNLIWQTELWNVAAAAAAVCPSASVRSYGAAGRVFLTSVFGGRYDDGERIEEKIDENTRVRESRHAPSPPAPALICVSSPLCCVSRPALLRLAVGESVIKR